MVFGDYALLYDIFYKNKNYKKECDFVEEVSARHGLRCPGKILDLGCGTGSHMLQFAKKGYEVWGVDRSARMLKVARCKLAGKKANLCRSKLEDFDLGNKFDIVVCMFSVIDYILADKDIIRVFKNVRNHMKPEALFIFDFWQDKAVERYFTDKKKKTYQAEDAILERRSRTVLCPGKKTCDVYYACAIRQGRRTRREIKEKHTLRYFSLEEIRSLLVSSGLKMEGAYPFLNLKSRIKKNTWDITAVAKKA